MISRSFAILLFVFLVVSSTVFAEQGKILEVVDGDTFKAEVEGKRGPESVDIHLRCSDAPVVTSAFGEESRKFLQQLLRQGSTVQYKVQAYCGSEKCVEALAYFTPQEDQPVSYINTEMIAAGMARNNGCRGQFAEAEANAKAARAGIWSTTAKITYSETRKSVTVKPATKSTSTTKSTVSSQEAPAIIRYDRAERTVTIKSRKMSLSRVVETINTVSPSPIKLYLQKAQFIPINVEKAHWYDALSYVVEAADLKQVNLDGKIDLYSRMFYYKHVSPYLKVAGNVGVYMNTGSAPQTKQAPDDGTTRYVFINEYENSAEVAKQYREAKARTEESINKSSGFIQVHSDSGPAPASDYGRFELSDQKREPVVVAAAEPEEKPAKKPVVAEKKTVPVAVEEAKEPARATLKPYSGTQPDEEEKPTEVAVVPTPAPTPEPVEEPKKEVAQPVAKVTEATQAPEKEVAAAETENREPAEKTEETAAAPAEKSPAKAVAASGPELEFSWMHGVAIVFIVLVVIFGCIFLTRSAGAKAAAAEKHVEPDELEEQEEKLDLDVDAQVDKKYEEEIFDEIDHVANGSAASDDEVEAGDVSDATDSEQKHEPKPLSGKEKRVQTEETPEDPVSGVADEGAPESERVPRKICLFEVKCVLDGNTFTGIGLDISPGGLFVDSKEEIEIGKVVELEFKLFEDDDKSVRCRGAVTWYNRRPDPIKPDYPNGFGVRFVDMEASTAQFINEYLATEDD